MNSKDLHCRLATLLATRHAGLFLDSVKHWSPTTTSLSSHRSLRHVTAMLLRAAGKTDTLLRSNSCRSLIKTQRAPKSTSPRPRKSYRLHLNQNGFCRRRRRASRRRSRGQFCVMPRLPRSLKCTTTGRTVENVGPQCPNHRHCHNAIERRTLKRLASALLLRRGRCRSAVPSHHSASHSPPTIPVVPESS